MFNPTPINDNILKIYFNYRLTFWSRWSTNVRKDTHRHVNERRKKQPYEKEGVPLHCNAEKSRVRFRCK